MLAPAPSTIGLLALLALLSWRAYKRFKRMVGRQRLSKVRPWITLTVFSLLTVLLAYGAKRRRELLEPKGLDLHHDPTARAAPERSRTAET